MAPKMTPKTSTARREQADALFHAAARRTLASLVSAYRDLQDQIAQITADQIAPLEESKKALMEDIRPLADQLGIEKEVVSPGAQLRHVVRTTTTILPERLLEKGVRMSVIEYATEEKVTEFYQVDRVKETGKRKAS